VVSGKHLEIRLIGRITGLFRVELFGFNSILYNNPCPYRVFRPMKQCPLVFLFLINALVLPAQDIPFIKSGQIEQWKQADTDTVWVLNFWATWCAPCVAELPSFEKLHANYADQKVKVVLISTDFKREVETRVKSFVKKKKLQSQVVFMDESNPNNWIDLVSPEWSGAIPATLIISKSKNQYLFFEKQLSYEELETALRSVL